MARKKTTTTPVEDIEQITEVNNTQVKSPSDASINKIGYQGTVWVTIKKNQQIISKKQYTNHGTTKLFHFLSACLANWDSTLLQNEAPTHIQLFTADNPSALEGNYIVNGVSRCVGGCFPLTESTIDNTGAAHLNFLIPGKDIQGYPIYQAGLYNNYWANAGENGPIINNYSAAFNFDFSNPIQINTSSADYTLYIDWIMSFDNK